MLPSSDDKKMLIESMKKLTHHISSNPVRQKQIFDSLTKNDLLKIISNLSDDNQYLRRISGLFLAELFYINDQIKQKATKLLHIYPSEGRICLNQIPYQIQKYPSTFKKCIQLMKSPLKQNEEDKFCWTINLDRKVLQIQFFDYKKYSSFTFLDPNRNIFGFTFVSKKRRDEIKRQLRLDKDSKQKSVKSIDSRGSAKKQSFGSNSSFYKNYLEFRNRKAQSPSSYRDYYEKKDYKPNTSRNHRNEYMPSGSKINNTIHSISQQGKINKDSFLYDKIGTPVKKSSDQYKSDIHSFHESVDLGSGTLRSPIGSAHREMPHRQISSGYREPQTDRKHDSYKYKLSESDVFGSSTAEKNRYPQSTKNNLNYQHDKFYKRVKEILKR